MQETVTIVPASVMSILQEVEEVVQTVARLKSVSASNATQIRIERYVAPL